MTRTRLRRVLGGRMLPSDRRAIARLIAAAHEAIVISGKPVDFDEFIASATARYAPAEAPRDPEEGAEGRTSKRELAGLPPVIDAPRRQATETKTAAIPAMGGGMAEPAPLVTSPSYAAPKKLIDLRAAPSGMEARAAGWKE